MPPSAPVSPKYSKPAAQVRWINLLIMQNSTAPGTDVLDRRAPMRTPLRQLVYAQMAWGGVLDGTRRRLVVSAAMVSSYTIMRPPHVTAVPHASSVASITSQNAVVPVMRQALQSPPGCACCTSHHDSSI